MLSPLEMNLLAVRPVEAIPVEEGCCLRPIGYRRLTRASVTLIVLGILTSITFAVSFIEFAKATQDPATVDTPEAKASAAKWGSVAFITGLSTPFLCMCAAFFRRPPLA